MARKIAGGFGKQAAFALALCWFLMPACRAEDLGAPPAAPPMSPPCDVPAMDIAGPKAFLEPPYRGGDWNSR